MELRIKKTGEVVNAYSIDARDEIIRIQYYTKNGILNHFDFDSLEEMNNVLEDYTPAEPLIKDEKIRKAVRAWAEANDIDRVWHECATCWLRGNGLEIFFEELELEQGNYTITELCGEKE